MKVAIMQPYLFPYFGYFQLINLVDYFVIYDDVNYINRGWINRNYVLLNGKPYLLTIPLKKASQNKLINEIELSDDNNQIKRILKLLEHAYSKAPYFKDVYPLIKNILEHNEKNLSRYIEYSIMKINDYIGIQTPLLISSSLPKNNSLRGEDKIIDICKILGANTYINPIGGKNLYDKKRFLEENINLNFLQSKGIAYQQYKHEFVPNLSIIDVLMFNDKKRIQELLGCYILR